MRVLAAHLYARLFARRHGCKYARIRGTDAGIMEAPNGSRFSFSLIVPGVSAAFGLPHFHRQLVYQLREASR